MMKTSALFHQELNDNHTEVKVTDKFWLNYMELIRTEMLPYQWRVLNDQEDIEIAKERDADYIPSEKSHAIENFKKTVSEGYTKKIGYAPSFYVANISEGTHRIEE